MPKKRKKSKVSKSPKKNSGTKLKRKVSVLIGTILFLMLIGTAWGIDWIFGVGFFIGFVISVYNKTLHKKPLLPIFIFLGGLIIRFAIGLIFPLLIKAENYISLGISLILLITLIIFGVRIKKGKL
jgi:membrane-associated protease RseP (regulator of RpoE activity)